MYPLLSFSTKSFRGQGDGEPSTMAKAHHTRNGLLYLHLGSRGRNIKSQGQLWLHNEFEASLCYNRTLSKEQKKERHIKREGAEDEEEKSIADFPDVPGVGEDLLVITCGSATACHT